jgi:hypothetical protein
MQRRRRKRFLQRGRFGLFVLNYLPIAICQLLLLMQGEGSMFRVEHALAIMGILKVKRPFDDSTWPVISRFLRFSSDFFCFRPTEG